MIRHQTFASYEHGSIESRVIGISDDVHAVYIDLKAIVSANVENEVGTTELWKHLTLRHQHSRQSCASTAHLKPNEPSGYISTKANPPLEKRLGRRVSRDFSTYMTVRRH